MNFERRNIAIETLTPVHIGSGETLTKNFDYIIKNFEEGSYVCVLDMKEIVRLLQKKNIDIGLLVSCLSNNNPNQSVKNFLDEHLPGEEYYLRSIYIPSSVKSTKELSEHIHDGFGEPYIPGSSLKGAIRTAIFTSLLKGKHINQNDIRPNSKIVDNILSFDNTDIKSNDPKDRKDKYMRLLQVSDAYFEQVGMDTLNMTHLNIRNRNSYDDDSKKQLVEAITTGEQSSFVMKITDTEKFPFHSIKDLFKIINKHTRSILVDEYNFWYDYEQDDNTGWLVNAYMETCSDIREQIDKLDDKSCILRVGNSNGWRFITGNWAREKIGERDWRNWVEVMGKKLRPHPEKHHEYDFPKSRRITKTQDGINLLGFVKLTIEE